MQGSGITDANVGFGLHAACTQAYVISTAWYATNAYYRPKAIGLRVGSAEPQLGARKVAELGLGAPGGRFGPGAEAGTR